MSTSESAKFNQWRWGLLICVFLWAASGVAQESATRVKPASPAASSESPAEPLNDSVRDLREQLRQLQAAVAEMRSDWQSAREETSELRRELNEVRAGTGAGDAVLRDAMVQSSNGSSLKTQQNGAAENLAEQNPPDDRTQDDRKKNEHAASVEEEYQLLSGKVDDQYQTKVESASKYRVRLSGIVLMNLVSNQGVVDSIDIPTLAYARPAGDSGGSFGATLRQSEIGFETFGPSVAGAKTSADLQLDLAGGFPAIPNGINSGIVRLRTATMRMDWTNTSVVVGQDALFFSPNSPTSFASLAIPALTNAGNLWSWVPQIRVEHKIAFSEDSSLLFQGGILDPVTGETPGAPPGAPAGDSYYRQAGPGEESRQPAYGTRIAWTRNVFGQPLRLGVGGYYNRQDYGFNRNVDGWAGMTDIELPLNRQLSLSGKIYRGRAVGGLYGALGQSVLFSGDPTMATTQVRALNSIGGWAQLKYWPANKWEFNAAFGMDNPYASDLTYFPYVQSYGDPSLAKNQAGFVNFIYRPRSDILFSAEYRRLKTYSLTEGANGAGHLNLMMGVLF
jgi:regulator of replication initiation timing